MCGSMLKLYVSTHSPVQDRIPSWYWQSEQGKDKQADQLKASVASWEQWGGDQAPQKGRSSVAPLPCSFASIPGRPSVGI